MQHFRDTVERYRHRIYTLSYYYLGQSDDAEDVTQEVLIRLWKHWDRVKDTNIKAWLIRVARNACVDALRKRKSYRSMVKEEDYDVVLAKAADDRLDPRSRLEISDLREQLRRALTRLDEPYRTIVILREIQELTYAEIGEALELPLTTVKVYLHRGRRMLRDQIRERVPNEEI